jgi:hypothetical protein
MVQQASSLTGSRDSHEQEPSEYPARNEHEGYQLEATVGDDPDCE